MVPGIGLKRFETIEKQVPDVPRALSLRAASKLAIGAFLIVRKHIATHKQSNDESDFVRSTFFVAGNGYPDGRTARSRGKHTGKLRKWSPSTLQLSSHQKTCLDQETA